MILSLRTDAPTAEISLFKSDGTPLSHHAWQADRQLAKDLLKVLQQQLAAHQAGWAELSGIIVFQGPGSFTGLRIGLTVANALAYAQDIPLVATKGDGWLQAGLAALKNGQNQRLALPHYGAEPHITTPKK